MKRLMYPTLLLLTLGATMLATQPSCNRQPAAYHNDPIPPHDELVIKSMATSESRTINIYLPPGYSESESKFPVIYMPDGGVNEDFPHVANTLDSLIRNGSIESVILVGIDLLESQNDQ